MTERAAQAARSVLSARSLAAATASAVRRRLTGRRFTSARSARQIVTKPTLLAGGERLCSRHISAWLNDLLRFTHRRLSALSSSLSKIL